MVGLLASGLPAGGGAQEVNQETLLLFIYASAIPGEYRLRRHKQERFSAQVAVQVRTYGVSACPSTQWTGPYNNVHAPAHNFAKSHTMVPCNVHMLAVR